MHVAVCIAPTCIVLSVFVWPTDATAQRQGVCGSTHPLPQPTTWQRTSPLRSSSRRRAAGRAASGWGLPLYPSGESAGGWAQHQTWWARQLGSGTSSAGCEQSSRLGETGPHKKNNNKNKLQDGSSECQSILTQLCLCMFLSLMSRYCFSTPRWPRPKQANEKSPFVQEKRDSRTKWTWWSQMYSAHHSLHLFT